MYVLTDWSIIYPMRVSNHQFVEQHIFHLLFNFFLFGVFHYI